MTSCFGLLRRLCFIMETTPYGDRSGDITGRSRDVRGSGRFPIQGGVTPSGPSLIATCRNF